MEVRKRSSTRIRKPTAKLRDNLNVTAIKSVSNNSINQNHSDIVADNWTSNSAYKPTCDDQSFSVTQDYGVGNESGLICKAIKTEGEEEKGNKNTAVSFNDVKNDTLLEFKQKGTNSTRKIIHIEESKPEDKSEDVLNSVKKQTVQVCVRLKDMILIPGKGCNEKSDKRKKDDDSAENSISPNENKRRKCLTQLESDDNDSDPVLNDSGKESLEENISDNVSHENLNLFKEDGSFLETYKWKAGSKGLRSCLSGSLKHFSNKEIGKFEELKETDKDVDVLAEIEFEHLDMSDEELSDADEDLREESLQCNICSKSFSKKYYLTKHMVLHRDVKPFQCEICGMSFATKAYLTLHSVVHSGIRKYKCNVCDKAFLRQANLNSHKRTHSDVKVYSCDTCNKKFKTKSGRDFHKKEHASHQEHQCHQCGKSFRQHSYLLKHISIHAGVKPFKCSLCEKSFPYNQSLQEHMRIHTGEKPETCDKCGKSFNNKRQLKSHMKYHNTVTQFSCKLCNMFYESEQSLNKHITKTHNRKYDCRLCSQSFVNKKHLRSHQNSEHKHLLSEGRLIPAGNLAKVKKAVCSLCNSVFFNRYVLSKHLMSIHHLPEQDMKELLNIRKKGSSKNHADKKQTNDLDVKTVDNDKSFRVYYKDDEMAVYVKGTDNFETRLKAMTESNETDKGGNKVDEAVRFIVLEDNAMNDVNNYNEVTYSNGANDVFDLKDNEMNKDAHRQDAFTTVASSTDEGMEEGVNTASSDQSYYVVFAEPNENSEKIVEQIQSEVIVKEEIQNLPDDGTERIVLILNEDDDGKNFMLENGEQLQILSNNMEFLTAENVQVDNEYEVVATDPLTVVEDLNCQKPILAQEECVVEASSKTNPVVTGTGSVIDSSNLPLLEQFQTREFVSDIEKLTNVPDKINSLERKGNSQNSVVLPVLSDKVSRTEILDVQCQSSSDTKELDLAEETYTFAKSGDTADPPTSMTSDINEKKNLLEFESHDLEEILPKNNSAEEFTNFENALKLKSGAFQSQDEYIKFIDKMIQTLQKAKHTEND